MVRPDSDSTIADGSSVPERWVTGGGSGGAPAGADSERGARWVMHLDMDAFFASVEQLTRPTLRGRPVLVGGSGGRGVVAGASYEARVFGARSAMPMHQARRLIGPAGVVVPPRGAVYGKVSKRVFRIVREAVPVIETLSFDEAFAEPAELAGASVAQAREFAEEVRARIRTECGLAASVGFGSGKQLAKIASGMAKPDGVMVIPPSGEIDFLHGLPVRKLWGIGPVSGDRLARLGIDTIGDLARMSTVEVASVLGGTVGPALHRLAQGIDDRPVAERASAKQISAESTFAEDIVDLDELRKAIRKAATDAHRRLLKDGRGARTVVLKLKRSDMSILTRSATTAAATTDFDDLERTAQRLALDPRTVGAIRLVGVGFSGLSAVQQYALFDDLDAAPDETTHHDTASAGGAASPSSDSGGIVEVSETVHDTTVDTESPEPVRFAPGGNPQSRAPFAPGADVTHPEFGHGWVQGSGHGVVTVRFETRTTGPGRTRTFGVDDPDLRPADPLDSLEWDLGADDE
ncbi:DNA polymerase IV [Gordonia alkanivorans]|uniref:DNA polymerase IV n=1 Tax=Gordonia alkanivorans TaxID=84096 RepID=UPI001F4E2C4D|nr:DNA polymerase IV [Gordonia alkanivorans]MDH3012048.1 DNA polymerase IV [Gordonia alkanivorans]